MKGKVLFLLVLVFLVGGFLGHRIAQSEKKQSEKKQKADIISEAQKKKIEIYLEKTLNIPSNISIKIEDIKDSEIKSLKILIVEFEDKNNKISNTQEYLVTNDYKYVVLGKPLNTTIDPYQEKMNKIDLIGRPTKGAKDAKVTMVVYSDFQCPYCVKMVPVEDEILKLYPNKVKIVFKNFPLGFHQWARDAALYSLCVFSQDKEKFWNLHNFLFQKQGEITKENLKEKIIGFCKEENIDFNGIQNCYDNKTTEYILNKDIEEANQIGVRSIPSILVQGKMITGAQSISTFKETIDNFLKE